MATDSSLCGIRQVRWPFVSRARFELLEHNYGALRSETHWLREEMSLNYERYSALLEKYHALKLQGAVAVEPVVIPAKKEADPAIQAINVLSAGKPGLRAQMMKQLNADRANTLIDEADIMQRIEMGVVIDEGLPA